MSNSESWTDKTENIIHLLHLFHFKSRFYVLLLLITSQIHQKIMLPIMYDE
jgi:hypothetical protein